MTKLLLKLILLFSIPFLCGYSLSYGNKKLDFSFQSPNKKVTSSQYSNIGIGIKNHETVYSSTSTLPSKNQTEATIEETKTEENENNERDFELKYSKPIVLAVYNSLTEFNNVFKGSSFRQDFAFLEIHPPLFILLEVFRI